MNKNKYLLSVLSIFLIMLLRAWPKFTNPQLWAEDGFIFVTEAYFEGWKSLLNSHDGYFHTLPRLIALFVTRFSVEHVPQGIQIISALLFSFMMARFICEEYSYLVENVWNRFPICIVWCFVPGLQETFANSTNLHWVLTFYLGFLGIRSLRLRGSICKNVFDVVSIFIIAGSAGESVVLIPLYLWRSYSSWKSRRNLGKFWHYELLAVLSLLFWAGINISIRQTSGRDSFAILSKLGHFLNYGIWNHFLLQPLVGDLFTYHLERSLTSLFWGLGLLILWGQVKMFQEKWLQWEGLYIWLACVILQSILMVWVRSDAFLLMGNVYRESHFSLHRYSFVYAGIGILFAMLLVSQWSKRFYAFWILCGIYICLAIPRFFLKPWEGMPRWSENIREARKICLNPVTDRATFEISPPVASYFVVSIPKEKICKK